MTIGSHFLHLCDIQQFRFEKDGYNQASPILDNTIRDVRCRLVEKRERLMDSENVRATTVTRYLLLLPAGTEVQDDNLIVNVRYEDGTEVNGKFEIEAILPRRSRTVHHISLELHKAS